MTNPIGKIGGDVAKGLGEIIKDTGEQIVEQASGAVGMASSGSGPKTSSASATSTDLKNLQAVDKQASQSQIAEIQRQLRPQGRNIDQEIQQVRRKKERQEKQSEEEEMLEAIQKEREAREQQAQEDLSGILPPSSKPSTAGPQGLKRTDQLRNRG